MSVVISGKHLTESKHVWIALKSGIYGIGRKTSFDICSKANIDPHVKLSTLSEEQIDALRAVVAELTTEGELRREVAMRIKQLMDMGSYRGIRHRRSLPVNGQRTKTNARTRKRRKSRDKSAN